MVVDLLHVNVATEDWDNEDKVQIFCWTLPQHNYWPAPTIKYRSVINKLSSHCIGSFINGSAISQSQEPFSHLENCMHLFCQVSVGEGRRENANSDAIIPPIKGNMGMLESGSIQQQTFREASFFLGKHKDISHHIASSNPQSGNLCMIVKASGTTEKHLKSLNSYLGQLHNKAKYLSWKIKNQKTEAVDRSDKLLFRNDDEPENIVENLEASLSTDAENAEGIGRDLSLKSFMESKIDDAEGGRYSADHASDFYLIGVLASINIAVLLFEIATPVKNSEFALFSIPSVYGAKVNNLILTGEWWRLVTPMFLHSGIFHLSLSIWVLFTFGLEVSQEYGSFTCLLIYLLGGISGNLISFLHTSSPTVGGTGPVFALIGAWLIYQVQNKDFIARESSERMFRKAIIFTALSFVVSSFGPIDDWAHFAAAFTGVAYGYVTCPSLQVKDASSETCQEDGMTLIRRYAGPCKSLVYFSIFMLLLSSLLFIVDPPLDLI
ncbi:RHOMBOID-like protein 9, chloroplastic isoform X2 [Primulina eburnea]|uniref:RHOMBOID-like protein 9, chloroplastic isoform X2 n=1 Tax=Primulina eburnea TaxID=1245227 RepID=UPI003C6C2B74